MFDYILLITYACRANIKRRHIREKKRRFSLPSWRDVDNPRLFTFDASVSHIIEKEGGGARVCDT